MTSWNERTNRTHSRQEWALVAVLAILLIVLAVFIGAMPGQAQAQGFPTMSSTSWSATDMPVPSAPTLNPFTPSPTPVFTVTLLPIPTSTPVVTPEPELFLVWMPVVSK
ncbi:MAG TPA: hypothetical protein VLA24_09305 [Pseudomonadales bacterium]|nr:hypothetical protein [Pseudomonadales bacterium]